MACSSWERALRWWDSFECAADARRAKAWFRVQLGLSRGNGQKNRSNSLLSLAVARADRLSALYSYEISLAQALPVFILLGFVFERMRIERGPQRREYHPHGFTSIGG